MEKATTVTTQCQSEGSINNIRTEPKQIIIFVIISPDMTVQILKNAQERITLTNYRT
jgi:hypothetical protein